jgi:hypothetical protein
VPQPGFGTDRWSRLKNVEATQEYYFDISAAKAETGSVVKRVGDSRRWCHQGATIQTTVARKLALRVGDADFTTIF